MGKNMLLLFDVDGTLTQPRKNISEEMQHFLLRYINTRAKVGLVGGSDLVKISEQMGGSDVLRQFEYVFSENGLVAHRRGVEVSRQSIQEFMGEAKLQEFINFTLRYLSYIILPVKRGTFIEFRTGLINVCPVGRSCSQSERDEFQRYDEAQGIRRNLVQALGKQFPHLGLVYVIGGQISIDVFPKGWDKTYCLNHIKEEFDEIHFFGDKTENGGNDHELFQHEKTRGHSVVGPDDTRRQLIQLFNLV